MQENITQDLEIQHGKPVIANSRVPVNVILGSLAGGMSYDDVMQEYGIKLEDIRACLRYATELITTETVHPLFVK